MHLYKNQRHLIIDQILLIDFLHFSTPTAIFEWDKYIVTFYLLRGVCTYEELTSVVLAGVWPTRQFLCSCHAMDQQLLLKQ